MRQPSEPQHTGVKSLGCGEVEAHIAKQGLCAPQSEAQVGAAQSDFPELVRFYAMVVFIILWENVCCYNVWHPAEINLVKMALKRCLPGFFTWALEP